jgi:molybdopterin-guanine dinucleotide biosynthesis protein A
MDAAPARVPAVVLAGGRPDPEMAGVGLPKAFAPLRGRTMVDFVLDALRGSPRIERIMLVGPRGLPPSVAPAVDALIPERGSLLDNLAAGLAGIDPNRPVLALAADVPLLTPPAITEFVDAACALDADPGYGVVPRADVERAFPGARKTYVRLRDGVFTGGSLFLITPGAFLRARPVLERAILARKRPWQLARLLGASTLIGLATGGLRIDALEARVERVAGIRARAVICHHPEIGLDVDRSEDLAAMERYLAARGAAPATAAAGAR